jgi:hypothetical protein
MRQPPPGRTATISLPYVDPSNIETREDLANFLSAVLADFRATGASSLRLFAEIVRAATGTPGKVQ